MQSQWHNLPMINGVQQLDGKEYYAENVKAHTINDETSYQLDISKAYPKEAEVNHWIRRFVVKGSTNSIIVGEQYSLKKFRQPHQLVFVTKYKPLVSGNKIQITLPDNKIVELSFLLKTKFIEVEQKNLDDPRLSKVWGDSIYRIKVEVDSRKLVDNIKYNISTKKER